jgi:hypothetical protein
MPRAGRYFLPEQPLHVIQRGNDRGAVFLPRAITNSISIGSSTVTRSWFIRARLSIGRRYGFPAFGSRKTPWIARLSRLRSAKAV